MTILSGVLVLALLCVFCVCVGAALRLDPALLALPALSGAAVVLFAAGCLGALRVGLWVALALLALGAACAGWRAGGQALRQALGSPAFWLFVVTSLGFWLLFAVQQPMFTQWDEFCTWGIAPKTVKVMDALYVARPYNLTAYHVFPATSLLVYLFLAFSPSFGEAACMAALDTLAMACVAAVAAGVQRRRWPCTVLVYAAGVLLPFFYTVLPAGAASTVYATAMVDITIGFCFGGAVGTYFSARAAQRAGLPLMLLPLALLAMLKDITFAYGLIAAFLPAVDRLLCPPAGALRPPHARLRQAGAAALQFVAAALPVLAVFLAWNRYLSLADTQTGAAAATVGQAGLGYGAVLLGGVRQLLGFGREARFATIMQRMGQAYFDRPVSALGSGVRVTAALALAALASSLIHEKGTAGRRRPLAAWLAFALCFVALYIFHLILYHYNFADVEALVLKDYERYLTPYYLGWTLVTFGLWGQSADADGRRAAWGGASLGVGVLALLALFVWRGVPPAGFWSRATSLYTPRLDVQRYAAAMNGQLQWDDRVLVLSQGDDATRWYYYKYELTATVVDGYSGSWWGDPEDTAERLPGDFMNLVADNDNGLYLYHTEGDLRALIAWMELTDCDYLLIDRADGYLEQAFSPAFAGGLSGEMAPTLFRFDAAAGDGICFTPVVTTERQVSAR